MKLVLHAGLHRAASSSLQSLLIRQRKAMGRSGVMSLERSVLGLPENDAFRALARPKAADTASRNRAVEGVATRLDELSHTQRCVILSDENMLGPMPGKSRTAFERRGFLSHCLTDLSRRFDVRVLIVLREHVGWLQSLYKFAVVRGESRDFERFTASIDPGSLLFAPMLDDLRAALRPGALIVLDFDAVRRNGGHELLATLACAADVRCLSDAELPRINVSPPAFLFDLICALNRRGICIGPGVGSSFLPLTERIAQGADNGEALAKAAILLARNAVRMPLPLRGRKRLQAARWLASVDRYGLLRPFSPSDAERLLEESLARAGRGELSAIASPAVADELRRRYANDRAEVAERYLPGWRDR